MNQSFVIFHAKFQIDMRIYTIIRYVYNLQIARLLLLYFDAIPFQLKQLKKI